MTLVSFLACSPQDDETKHDQALQFVIDAHGVDPQAEAEAQKIRGVVRRPSSPDT